MRIILCISVFFNQFFIQASEYSITKKMPGPGLWNFLFNYSHLFVSDTYKAIDKLYLEHGGSGDPVNIYIPGIRNIVFVYDPEDISTLSKEEKNNRLKKGYTIDFVQKYLLGKGFAGLEQGEEYKNLHKYMLPFFARKKISDSYSIIKTKIRELFEKEILEKQDGEIVDIQEIFKSLSMSIILKTMMNFDISFNQGLELNKKIDFILEYISYRQLHSPFNLPDWLPTKFNQSYQESKKFLDDFCYSILDYSEKKNLQDGFVKHLLDNGVERETIKDQILNILFGGFETTSHWMSMCLYRLSFHPKYKDSIVEEINAKDELSNARDLSTQNFPYLYSFAQEVLRLNSPIQIYGRDATTSFRLRDRFVIEKGSLVISAQYFSHRYGKSWTNPEEFVAERFHPLYRSNFEKEKNRHVRSFYPFGHGQRSCVGRFLADLEVRTLIYEYLKQTRFYFEHIESEPPEIEIICTARFKNGLKMKLVKNISS
jgi:cytochrome P450